MISLCPYDLGMVMFTTRARSQDPSVSIPFQFLFTLVEILIHFYYFSQSQESGAQLCSLATAEGHKDHPGLVFQHGPHALCALF